MASLSLIKWRASLENRFRSSVSFCKHKVAQSVNHFALWAKIGQFGGR